MFWLKLWLYSAPFALILGTLFGFSLYVGDAFPFTVALSLQRSDTPTLLEYDWSREDNFDYKLRAIQMHQPELLLLGSSRGFYFRGALAHKQPDQFYNASIAGMNIVEAQQMVQILVEQGAMPDILLLILDYPDFNAAHPDFRARDTLTIETPTLASDLNLLQDGTHRLILQAYNDPQQVLSMLGNMIDPLGWRALGSIAQQEQRGYFADGARRTPNLTPDVIANNRTIDERRLANAEYIFARGEQVDEERVALVADILQVAREHETIVFGIFPPYQDFVYEMMKTAPDFGYVRATEDALVTMFEAADYPLYNFSDSTDIGGDDSELFDAWHAGERLSLRMYMAMVADYPEIFAPYSDLETLETILSHTDHPFYTFPP